MRRPVTRAIVLTAAVLALLVCVCGAWLGWHARIWPRRFDVVAAGRLYRAGEVTPDQLARLQRDYRVGRVISLLSADAPETRAERDAALRLGIDWQNIPLRGNGASTPADRDRLRDLLTQPDAPPTLVHCDAGVNRTGLAVGMYRLHCEHWTLEQVLAELRRTDFEDLPKHENLRAALAAEAELAAPPAPAPDTQNNRGPVPEHASPAGGGR